MESKSTHLDACPLCRKGYQPDAAIRGHGRHFQYCHACQLIAVPSQQHLPAAAQRARYASHQNTMENAGYVAMLNRIIVAFETCARPAHRVLDFGCGPGPVLVQLLREKGYDAIGYDPFFAPHADLRQRFDAIFSTETFEHLAEPSLEIDRMIRLLAPSATLAVMTRMHPGPSGMADWWYARDPTHVVFYAPATMDWIAHTWGLRIEFRDTRDITIFARDADSTG